MLRVFIALFLAQVSHALHAEEWRPIQHSLDRYEKIWRSSPFIGASEVTPQSDSLAQRYAVTGFARIGNADVVFLIDRKTLNRFSVGTGRPAENVELVEVTNSGQMSSLRARIKAQGQVADVGFDAGLAAGDAGGRMPNAAEATPPQAVPSPVAPSQVVSPAALAAGKTAPNGNKPGRIIRRKPIAGP